MDEYEALFEYELVLSDYTGMVIKKSIKTYHENCAFFVAQNKFTTVEMVVDDENLLEYCQWCS